MLDVQGVHDDMGIPDPIVKAKGKAKAKSTAERTTRTRTTPRPKRERVEEEPLRRSTRRRYGNADFDETPEEKEKREVRLWSFVRAYS